MSSYFKYIYNTTKGKFALSILFVFLFLALFGQYLTIDPSQIPEGADSYMPPGTKILSSGRTMIFGTDQIGRDVWSGVIYGARWAFLVGVLSTLLSLIIGVFFGSIAGYFGNTIYKVNLYSLGVWLLLSGIGLFYLIYCRWALGTKLLTSFIAMLVSYYLVVVQFAKLISLKGGFFNTTIPLPLDSITLRSIEVWRAVPAMFVLLAILAVVKHPSIWTVIIVIGLVRWIGIARLLRAELLSVREQNYIKSAQAVGFSHARILIKHALPNAIRPIFVVCAFSISIAIILEATLSFLGIGVSTDIVTWGSLMSAARDYHQAWWLAVFPGFCIFLLVFSLNIIGDMLSEDL